MDYHSLSMDYDRLQQTMADYSRILTMVSTMASSDRCQWVGRTMKALLLSFTAVETMEVVLQEVSGETAGVFLGDSKTAICPRLRLQAQRTIFRVSSSTVGCLCLLKNNNNLETLLLTYCKHLLRGQTTAEQTQCGPYPSSTTMPCLYFKMALWKMPSPH